MCRTSKTLATHVRTRHINTANINEKKQFVIPQKIKNSVERLYVQCLRCMKGSRLRHL
jgi:hypothetical protein